MAQFACDFTMAKTRHILFLVTTIVACIDNTNGGYYSGQTPTEIQNQNNQHLNTNIEVSNNQNQPDLSNQNLEVMANNEDISTRYELDQTVPQNINEEQYRNVINQLESEHKPENHYSNQEQASPNTIQSANTPAASTNLESNLLPNQLNSVQNVNTNEVQYQQIDSFRTTHTRTFNPSLNYANGAIAATNPLPLSAPLPARSVLPPGNIVNLFNRSPLLPLPLSAPPTLVTGHLSNVQNISPQANIGVLPAQPISIHHLSLNPVSSLVSSQIPVNYNAHHLTPAVIPAQPIPALPLPLGPSQVVVNEPLPLNSGVHVLEPDNSGLLSLKTSLLPPPVNQQLLISGQHPINLNVQNVPPLLPADGQLLLNGASVSDIGQSLLPVQSAPAAVITKDIYFHAAPPGFEDEPAPPPPPKKTYKIIFIKLPSQERRNAALIQSLYSQQAAREDKTLIYVLVKNPEVPQVLVPQPKGPSEHEVVFVKYRNIKGNSATLEANETEHKHNDSLLKPGLANGH